MLRGTVAVAYYDRTAMLQGACQKFRRSCICLSRRFPHCQIDRALPRLASEVYALFETQSC